METFKALNIKRNFPIRGYKFGFSTKMVSSSLRVITQRLTPSCQKAFGTFSLVDFAENNGISKVEQICSLCLEAYFI